MTRAFPLAIPLSLAVAAASAQISPAPKPRPAAPTPPPRLRLRRSRSSGRSASSTGGRTAMIENAVVVIEGLEDPRGRLGDLAVPAGATVVDLGDATLLPGLHRRAHAPDRRGVGQLARRLLRGPAPVRAGADAPRSTYARKTLEAGFTTVRNVGAEKDEDVGLRNAIRKGWIDGPRMLVSRYALGATGGHCDNTGFPPETFGHGGGPREGASSTAPTRPARPCACRSSTARTSSRCAPPAASCRSATTSARRS